MRTLGMNIGDVVRIEMTTKEEYVGRVYSITNDCINIIRQKPILKEEKEEKMRVSGEDIFSGPNKPNPKVLLELVFENQTVDAPISQLLHLSIMQIVSWKYEPFENIMLDAASYQYTQHSWVGFLEKNVEKISKIANINSINHYSNNGICTNE